MPSKTIIFMGSIWDWHQKNFRETKLCLQLKKFTQKSEFGVLPFRGRA